MIKKFIRTRLFSDVLFSVHRRYLLESHIVSTAGFYLILIQCYLLPLNVVSFCFCAIPLYCGSIMQARTCVVCPILLSFGLMGRFNSSPIHFFTLLTSNRTSIIGCFQRFLQRVRILWGKSVRQRLLIQCSSIL